MFGRGHFADLVSYRLGNTMPRVIFSSLGTTTDAVEGEWMYDVCTRARAPVPFSCKAGACGICATLVSEGHAALGEQTAREIRTLQAAELDPSRHRLLCLSDVHGDVVIGDAVHEAGSGQPLAVHEVEVEAVRPLNHVVTEVRFFVRGGGFEFQPGQYVILHVPKPGMAARRSYSISTPPWEKRHFEICVRAVPGGYGSNYVHRLRPGRVLRVEGPVGEFVLEDGDTDLLMIATGTGIAPIKRMLLHLLAAKKSRRVRLFFGVRHETDLFYTDLMRGLTAHYPNFEAHVTLSQPGPTWRGVAGRVTDLVDRHVGPGDASRTDAYLCGGADMIVAVRRQLRERGFDSSHIHHENFY